MPPPRDNIHEIVYYSDIQISSSLKLLGQSKPNFMEVGMKVYINGQGHTAKMASMPINSKNL